MTRSSGMDFDMGDVVAEEASHPFQVSFRPCFRAAPCHQTWLGELPLLMVVQQRGVRFGGLDEKKKKKAAVISSWLN